MLGKLLKSGRSVYLGLIGAFWAEVFNLFGLFFFFLGVIVHESTIASLALGAATLTAANATDIIFLGIALSFIFTAQAFIIGLVWFTMQGKIVWVGDNPYAMQKMLWTIVFLAGSIFVPGCFIGWVLMIEYYHLKKVLRAPTKLFTAGKLSQQKAANDNTKATGAQKIAA